MRNNVYENREPNIDGKDIHVRIKRYDGFINGTSIDSTVTRLAGNPYGREVYNKQLKGKIDFDTVSVIVFPKEIENFASSFVQGFCADIV